MTPPGPKLVIFTDLDGTLLSTEDYDPGCSIEALALCKENGIPVVFVSSKTRAEIAKLRQDLTNQDPFISENGGGIYLPADQWERPTGFIEQGEYWAQALGMPHDALMDALLEAAEKCHAGMEMFSRISVERVMELTGLTRAGARLAQMREFDEPFLLTGDRKTDFTCLETILENKGISVTRGGRFYHIMGGSDKGKAVQYLMGLYREIRPDLPFMAVGDSENDLPMLKSVEHPFLVRKPDGSHDRTVCFDSVTVTQGIGPEGFFEAVQHATSIF